MTTPSSALKYFDVLAAKQAYAEGRNVTELLRAQCGSDCNTSAIIETAYDLQAGTYIAAVERAPAQARAYASEMAAIIDHHICATDAVLDIGTGELTTLSLTVSHLRTQPQTVLAFDVSWSRVFKGLSYARAHMGAAFDSLRPFVADIAEIPLCDQSVDVTISSHALEPNGGKLPALMAELFRVTRSKLILFEPCYEINSEEGKQRMDRLGYIKGVDEVVASLGGTVIDKVRMSHVSNPLNPTVCFVIDPPQASSASPERDHAGPVFSVPGSNLALTEMDGFHVSADTGLCFPILKSIPILKSSSAILASALSEAV